nr:MAG TPA: hypothetical protein [Bacteriophage sp.]
MVKIFNHIFNSLPLLALVCLNVCTLYHQPKFYANKKR